MPKNSSFDEAFRKVKLAKGHIKPAVTKAEDGDEVTCPECGCTFSADGYRTSPTTTETGNDDDSNNPDNNDQELTAQGKSALVAALTGRKHR